MKRVFLVMALMVTMLTAVFAGGQKASAAADGNVTLTAYMQIDPVDPQYTYWQPTLDAFYAKYPNIKIEFEYVSGEPFHQKFQAMAASGDIPDLFTLYPSPRSSYVINRGMVKDLRPYLTDEIKSHYPASIWDAQGKNGEVYIISPNMAIGTIVYVNTKLQKELGLSNPKTLDDLIAQGPAIRAAGKTPLMFGNQGVWQAQSLLLSCLVERTGGKEWFDRARAGTAKFTDKPFVDALAVIKQLVDTQTFPAGVNQIDGLGARNAFIQGNAVYLLAAGWSIGGVKEAAPAADYAQYEIIPFPALPNEAAPNSNAVSLGEALAINNKLTGAKADAAFAFISFIYGEVGSDLFMKTGNLPTYKLDYSKYPSDSVNQNYIDRITTQTMGYIIDGVMDGEGCDSILNPGIQAVMLGTKTPAGLAAEYEAWVAANDSNRKK
ncbi:ABC transporter substrate-binding protein [Bacilli bacterium]|nr:ABC transporter substrate-binding protein [Bacilli bacterium]